MIFHQLAPAPIKIMQSIVFLLLYLVGEYSDSYYPNIVNSVLNNVTIIDPYNVTNFSGYAFFESYNTKYPVIYDEYLNLTVFGAAIKKNVLYCQYEQKFEQLGIFYNTPSYETVFRSTYQNSTKFFDSNYKNPPLKFQIDGNLTTNDLKIGNITIPSSFFDASRLVFYYFQPTENGLLNFSYSNSSKDFEFIQNGYFYHSINGRSPTQTMEKIKNEIRNGKLLDPKEILNDAQKKFFKKCHPGDISLRYLLYAPLNTTYFGYVENFTLKEKYIKNIRFGATARGTKHSVQKLVEANLPEEILEMDLFSNFFTFPFFLIKFPIFVNVFTFILRRFENRPLVSAFWILTAGIANLAFRSLFWNRWYMNFSVWMAALLVMLSVGFVTRIICI